MVHPHVSGYAAEGTPKEPGGREERGSEHATGERAVMGDPRESYTVTGSRGSGRRL